MNDKKTSSSCASGSQAGATQQFETPPKAAAPAFQKRVEEVGASKADITEHNKDKDKEKLQDA
eukprot:4818406-Pyramimonas_sp.AAC.1